MDSQTHDLTLLDPVALWEDNHSDSHFPKRGSRRIRGAAYDVSEENEQAILNFHLASYACLSREICPLTQRPHIQFYLVCPNTVRLSTLRASIKKAGFQSCDGSHESNILYVKKQREQDYDRAIAAGDHLYQGNQETFKERGDRPDERRALSRTLSSLFDIEACYKKCNHLWTVSDSDIWAEAINGLNDSIAELLEHYVLDDETDLDDDIAMDMFDRDPCTLPPKKRKQVSYVCPEPKSMSLTFK